MNYPRREDQLGALGDERSPEDRAAYTRSDGFPQAAGDSRSPSMTDHHWKRGLRRGSLDRTLPSYVKHAAFGPRRQERVSAVAVGERATGRRRHSEESAPTASAGRGTCPSQSERHGEIHSPSFATRLTRGHHEGRAPDAAISVRIDDETTREGHWALAENLPGISERPSRDSNSVPDSDSSGSTSQHDAAAARSSPKTPTVTLQRKSHPDAHAPDTSDRSSDSRSSSSASGQGSSRSMGASDDTTGESPAGCSDSPDPVAPGTAVRGAPPRRHGVTGHASAGEGLEARHVAPGHKHLGECRTHCFPCDVLVEPPSRRTHSGWRPP